MSDFTPGQILDDRYEILGVLGAGGMGRVYKARQLNLDRTVAIKVPSAAVLGNGEFLARFVREGRTCAQVAHDHIVAIYDVHSGDLPYIVMEYVHGRPLNQFVQEEQTALFVSDLLDIVGQVCKGLSAAHARHIVHRDIKPGNIVITHETHRVKVMDFGIARVSENTSLTATGSMMGTPYYMAPEQIRGDAVGPSTDLYALACVVYYLLTGKQVFDGEVATLIYKHMSVSPVTPRDLNPMLPPAANQVLLRALHKNPAERFDSVLEFHRELCKALRPIAHLPYPQIFASPESLPRPLRVPPVDPGGAAARPTLTQAPPPADAALPVATAAPVPVPAAAVVPPEVAALAGMPPDRSRRRFLLQASGLAAVLLLLAVAGYYYRPGPAGRREPGPPAPAALTPTAPAAPSAASAVRLLWAGEKPAAQCQPGDYYLAGWFPDPAPPGDAVYHLLLTRAGAPENVELDLRTGEDRMAQPVQTAGRYRLRVELLDAAGRVAATLDSEPEAPR